MSLGEQQRKFAFYVSQLIQHIYANGMAVTFGDAYRDPRAFGAIGQQKCYGHPNSNHKRRLAIDLNLFSPDGTYLTDTESHRPFGEWWEHLHPRCRWGGRYDDANHYEYMPSPWR